ncbi:hypothetical protein F4818DRAFT_419251 [Hypoxylon cercidicola]|nr:hypothetical protein F4818DRAFT_419251 [Hypoxylon cercidicola]
MPQHLGRHAYLIHQHPTPRREAIHKLEVPERLHATTPRALGFDVEPIDTLNERSHSFQSNNGKSKAAINTPGKISRKPTLALSRYINHNNTPGKNCQASHIMRRASTDDIWPTSYTSGEHEFSSHIHHDASLYHSELQSGFSGDKGRRRSCPTSMKSLSIEANEACSRPIGSSASHTVNYTSLSSRMMPSNALREDEDNQDCMSVIPSFSSLSSIGIDIPYPDDFWTWSPEKNNYFHIRQKPDGTEETLWYPTEFA